MRLTISALRSSMGRSAAAGILLGLTFPALAFCASAGAGSREEDEVTLLKFPYPYQAAVTVASDTHSSSIQTFEAVHRLVRSRQRIERGSEAWRLLFADPAIDRLPKWNGGIEGFGLPIADSCWLYHPVTGVFAGYDELEKKAVPHRIEGGDYGDIVDGWIRKGWVDTLHTLGEGDLKRDAIATGLAWISSDPRRRLTVWSDHTYTETPACIGPGGLSALSLVLKNLAKVGTEFLCLIGQEPLARRIAASPHPSPFPRGQKLVVDVLQTLMLASTLWLVLCAALMRLRTLKNASLGGLALGAVLVPLYMIKLDFCLGDNPNSPYYSLDLVRQAGLRYFWLIPGAPGYQPEIPDTLLTDEWSYAGRRSSLGIVPLDDGSRCFVFARCYKGDRGLRSLELLSEQGLTELCEAQGTAILYTHWVDAPTEVFTAAGLEGLERLRRFREEGRIWVAPTSTILQFTFVRTFMTYASRRENGRRVIEIDPVVDPTGGTVQLTLHDLRGISFEMPDEPSVEIRVEGKAVDSSLLFRYSKAGRLVLGFRLEEDSGG
ncbi:MAG TPA: hypothetical protein VN898_10150 [Candidatus Binatia bacterium]|nr:hypothetical protein [Candidatus Binatia bacterium]